MSSIRLAIAALPVMLLVLTAAAQQPAQHQSGQDDRPAIDGATFPIHQQFQYPGARIAPDSAVDFLELPPTQRPANAGHPDAAGYVDPSEFDLLASGWSETADGTQVRAVELHSVGAYALRVRFHGRLADGVFLRVYDPASGAAFGPVRTPFLNEQGDWWTTIIFGESIGLEFSVPPGAEVPARLPEINGVAHYYAGPLNDAAAGTCALHDVACEPDWVNSEALAVCMLAWVNNNNVAGFCSGALLNRTPADGSPLVMTANHCIGSQSNANDAAFVWHFQNSECAGNPPNPNNLPRSNGSLLLKQYTSSDWNLLGLYEPPAESVFLGWDSGFWVSFADCTGIHHPQGTYKRISFGENIGELYGYYCDQNGQNCFWANVWNVAWDFGMVRPGSSGSPIMDTSRRVRGTLTGSNDDCHAQYGRFGMAYDELEPFIYFPANPVFVERTYVGFERGTSAQPFNSLFEASFCVREGSSIVIRAGTYSDHCRIWRPMTLTASGGIARIGQ